MYFSCSFINSVVRKLNLLSTVKDFCNLFICSKGLYWMSITSCKLGNVHTAQQFWVIHCQFDVHGSVHHSAIHTEMANKMQQCIKIYYSMFIWSSTCFGRHTSHHQELKTVLVVSGFAYVKGCGRWGCWTLSASNNHNVQQPFTYAKPEAASAVLSSWWWAVCSLKHVELHVNME
jgi:hypothetical protein